MHADYFSEKTINGDRNEKLKRNRNGVKWGILEISNEIFYYNFRLTRKATAIENTRTCCIINTNAVSPDKKETTTGPRGKQISAIPHDSVNIAIYFDRGLRVSAALVEFIPGRPQAVPNAAFPSLGHHLKFSKHNFISSSQILIRVISA